MHCVRSHRTAADFLLRHRVVGGPGFRLLRDLAQQLLVTVADWRSAAAIAGEGAAVIAEALRRLGARTASTPIRRSHGGTFYRESGCIPGAPAGRTSRDRRLGGRYSQHHAHVTGQSTVCGSSDRCWPVGSAVANRRSPSCVGRRTQARCRCALVVCGTVLVSPVYWHANTVTTSIRKLSPVVMFASVLMPTTLRIPPTLPVGGLHSYRPGT